MIGLKMAQGRAQARKGVDRIPAAHVSYRAPLRCQKRRPTHVVRAVLQSYHAKGINTYIPLRGKRTSS